VHNTRVIITGGPGAGKTTLLSALADGGFPVVEESARAIIAERRARGASPRPAPLAFAREILRRDRLKYAANSGTAGWVFFDRGLVEALAMVHEAQPLPEAQLQAELAAYPFHPTVFVLPPWEEIYSRDTERDQTLAEAVRVHARVVEWYAACGYLLEEVPRVPVAERAAHVVRVLDGAA